MFLRPLTQFRRVEGGQIKHFSPTCQRPFARHLFGRFRRQILRIQGVPFGKPFGKKNMLCSKPICMVGQGIYGRGPPPLETRRSEAPGEDNRRGREHIPHAW